jgi:rRNA processing protein Gar1
LFEVPSLSTTVGKVIRITGPVSRPYVILKPFKDEPNFYNSLLGRELFISDKKVQDRNRRGGKGRNFKQDRSKDRSRDQRSYERKRPPNEQGKKDGKQYGRRIGKKHKGRST